MFQSNTLSVQKIEGGIAELTFNNANESVNKFDQATIDDLSAAIDALEADSSIKGLLVTSAKPVFIVGADIIQISANLDGSPDSVLGNNNANFNRIEKLPFPTCVAINGFALGGGFEFALSCDFRVMSTVAKIGLPEVKLGIIPGWGGTLRLPRVIGIDEAIMWIATGNENRPDEALRVGAVDATASPETLKQIAIATLSQAIDGKLDYKQRREAKSSPLPINPTESMMAFTTAKALVAGQAGRHYPAPIAAVEVIEKAHTKGTEEALKIEGDAFLKLAQTDQAKAMIGNFLSDQFLAKKAKKWAKQASKEVNQAAVLGAGIMGGGIAYQSSYTGTPIIMKDINQEGLNLGLSEASKLLSKRVKRGKMTPEKMGEVLNNIDPALTYGNFGSVDIVIEAVVENPKVKHAVLAETEKVISENSVLCSNTSTISITYLAEALERPENFCGMHFFNPVHRMPLVEIIRAEKTSDEAIALAVAYANKMKKKPVVVNDCPGFLVNRVLFPYFFGFNHMITEGLDFVQADRVMEKFGWPMGPAFLNDVVGMDTSVHGGAVMTEAFPDRMTMSKTNFIEVLVNNGRLGQKTGTGFYNHSIDKRGKPKKEPAPEAYELMKAEFGDIKAFEDQDIVDRCMVPMAIEMARCIEEGIVETVAEADIALLFGLGFPPFRGGIMRWVDSVGLEYIAKVCEKYASLGPAYEMTETMKQMLADGKTYY